jgi:hypothetical protein
MYHEGNVPSVNNVCFCFPLPFLLFPRALEGTSTSLSSAAAAGRRLSLPFPFPLPACHADAEGGIRVAVPNTFFRETFPLTCGFCLGAADVGSSGKSESDNLGGGCFGMVIPDPGCDIRGSEMTVIDWLAPGPPEAGWKPDELADQGVVLWGCRKAGVTEYDG